jgi:hypothetical protein
VEVLAEMSAAEWTADYSEFFRADLEAITIFHRTGTLPVWREFLAAWHQDLRDGRRARRPFAPRPLPAFHPVRIDQQVVKQGV